MSVDLPVSPKRLFPLHLTPFENYMLWDDRPLYPSAFVLQFEFSGKLLRAEFERGLEEALARHPLLLALVRPAKLNRECWVSSGTVRPAVSWGGLEDEIVLERGEQINLREEVGLRVWVRNDERRAVVTMQFHHSVCDGIGSYQFVGDWLACYAAQCGEPLDEPLPPLDPLGLRQRLRVTYKPENYRHLDSVAPPALHHSTPLQTPSNGPTGKPPFPGIRTFDFDKETYRRLRLAAQERGQTANDLLLQKFFLMLHQWNRQNHSAGDGSLSVLVPIDLRDQAERWIPAANLVAMTFLRRERDLLEQPDKLANSLRDEMVRMKQDRHCTTFMGLISGVLELTDELKSLMNGDHCIATATFSNTGDPTRRFHGRFPQEPGNAIRCGNLVLESIAGVPPIRSLARLTASSFTYRRGLKICFRCDPHLFSPEDTQQLLDLYVATVLEDLK